MAGEAVEGQEPAEATDVVMGEVAGDSPAAAQALQRLLLSNAPGKLSLAGAYAFGYGELGLAGQEGRAPYWYEELDPLDTVVLGAVWPQRFRDEFEFANVRDAWLRLLRGTDLGMGIQKFVREVLSLSAELQLPVDDAEVMLALAARLEQAGLDDFRVPQQSLPGASLGETRVVRGPDEDLAFPEPPADVELDIDEFWMEEPEDLMFQESPRDILRLGLHRLAEAGLPVGDEPACLLVALYAALLAKPGERHELLGEHAGAWALSFEPESPLAPVLDVLFLAPERELPVDRVLAHLFALPAFTAPIPDEALRWTSSPGLALPALAFELGFDQVHTRHLLVTPGELDFAGTQARVRLVVLRGQNEKGGGKREDEWDSRLNAVRETARRKVHKKKASSLLSQQGAGHAVERLWNADGSSEVRWPSHAPEERVMSDGLAAQREYFRERFGRETGPDDPVFFDDEADEPTPMTVESWQKAFSEAAERAGVDPSLILATRDLGYIVTEANQGAFTRAEVITYLRAVRRHRKGAEG
ncbi:hypothetical protein ABXV03_03945 [Streptomyces harbinensis]|uniref:hypothetical protein n=1 Tax=Streptomyces harbinensis TaxID=1176198 RepID=UPI003399BAF1